VEVPVAPNRRVVYHAIILSSFVVPPSGLELAMQNLGVRSALVVASQAVDESPVWSPISDAIGVNIEGQWKKVDLRSPKLAAGTWHGKEPIGVLETPSLSSISEAEVRTWEKTASAGPREVVAKDGTKAELLSEGLGTRFVITRKGAAPETLWTTSMENCHSLALSPDGRQVAYICELNGVIVTNLSP
jgi:hypothetical protein